jgi:4-amino-4-deoxy-L-arabinose transferase-like glycosyltransferase
LLVIAVSLPFLVHPWYDSSYSDAGSYVATARSLAAGEGYTHLERPFSLRPPGFSLILAPIVSVFGTSSHAFNWAVSLLGATGIVLLYGLTRRRLGWPLAIGLAAAVWLNPAYRQLCNQAMADVPGLTFILAGLVLATWADEAPSWRRELVLGLLIGAAWHVRTVALLLVPAIVISRVWRRLGATGSAPPWRPFLVRRAVLLTLVVVLGVLPWTLRNRAVAPEPPADQTLAYSNSTGMWHRDPADPRSPRLGLGAILERIPANGRRVAAFVGSRLTEREPSPSSAALALLALAGLGAMLFKHRAPAEFFALGLLATLLVYYDIRDRLLLPVWVLAFAAVVELLRDLLRRWASSTIATGVVSALLVLLIWHDIAFRQHWPRVREMDAGLSARCEAIEAQVDEDARLATGFNWHYGVCLDRPVFSLLWAIRRSGRVGEAESVIDKYGVDTVVLDSRNPADAQLLHYFRSNYRDVRRRGNVLVFRVRQ